MADDGSIAFINSRNQSNLEFTESFYDQLLSLLQVKIFGGKAFHFFSETSLQDVHIAPERTSDVVYLVPDLSYRG